MCTKSTGEIWNHIKVCLCRYCRWLSDSSKRLTQKCQQTNVVDTTSGPKTDYVFGRVVHMHSLSPIITLQLLVCLGNYFVLDRLFATLLSRGPSLGYHPHWTFGHGPGNMWYFSMKYYYLLDQESTMYLTQTTGKFHDQEKGMRICCGTSMAAVRFAEDGLNNSSAPSSKTPWRLLVLTCSKEMLECHFYETQGKPFMGY